jgi:hypothetical protein
MQLLQTIDRGELASLRAAVGALVRNMALQEQSGVAKERLRLLDRLTQYDHVRSPQNLAHAVEDDPTLLRDLLRAFEVSPTAEHLQLPLFWKLQGDERGDEWIATLRRDSSEAYFGLHDYIRELIQAGLQSVKVTSGEVECDRVRGSWNMRTTTSHHRVSVLPHFPHEGAMRIEVSSERRADAGDRESAGLSALPAGVDITMNGARLSFAPIIERKGPPQSFGVPTHSLVCTLPLAGTAQTLRVADGMRVSALTFMPALAPLPTFPVAAGLR